MATTPSVILRRIGVCVTNDTASVFDQVNRVLSDQGIGCERIVIEHQEDVARLHAVSTTVEFFLLTASPLTREGLVIDGAFAKAQHVVDFAARHPFGRRPIFTFRRHFLGEQVRAAIDYPGLPEMVGKWVERPPAIGILFDDAHHRVRMFAFRLAFELASHGFTPLLCSTTDFAHSRADPLRAAEIPNPSLQRPRYIWAWTGGIDAVRRKTADLLIANPYETSSGDTSRLIGQWLSSRPGEGIGETRVYVHEGSSGEAASGSDFQDEVHGMASIAITGVTDLITRIAPRNGGDLSRAERD